LYSNICQPCLQEKLVFLAFFFGAAACLAFSALYHTVACHSQHVSASFCKLDYAGIPALMVGGHTPWIYYAFYHQFEVRAVYMTILPVLAAATIVTSLWDKFNTKEFRDVILKIV
jgi:adiponectin receptor